MTIQRWRPAKGDINKIKMETSETGKYVTYADHLAAIGEVKEMCAAECDRKAFLCHTHDEHGKGRERGMLDCVAAIRALKP